MRAIIRVQCCAAGSCQPAGPPDASDAARRKDLKLTIWAGGFDPARCSEGSLDQTRFRVAPESICVHPCREAFHMQLKRTIQGFVPILGLLTLGLAACSGGDETDQLGDS